MEEARLKDGLRSVNRQIVAWLLGLLALTLLGALPLLLQGLNLNDVWAHAPHLPWIMMGMLVTSCSPTLAVLLVAGFHGAGGGARSIFRQVRIWRVPLLWYAIAILGPFCLLLLAQVGNRWWLGQAPSHWITLPSFSRAGGLAFVIFGSLVAEEPGWRGFAQPRLQIRYGALLASLLVGLVWSTWHLWYVILPGGFSSVTGTDAVATYIRLTATAIIYAWMYNGTNGSLLIPMLAHLGHNLAASSISMPGSGGRQHLIIAIAYLIAATPVVVFTDPKTLR